MDDKPQVPDVKQIKKNLCSTPETTVYVCVRACVCVYRSGQGCAGRINIKY